MARHNELGRLGEEKAADYLQQKGYIILDRNWHLKHRELDIVCMYENMLVIVEVKRGTLRKNVRESCWIFGNAGISGGRLMLMSRLKELEWK